MFFAPQLSLPPGNQHSGLPTKPGLSTAEPGGPSENPLSATPQRPAPINHMGRLPSELLLDVLDRLNPINAERLEQTCKCFKGLRTHRNHFWTRAGLRPPCSLPLQSAGLHLPLNQVCQAAWHAQFDKSPNLFKEVYAEENLQEDIFSVLHNQSADPLHRAIAAICHAAQATEEGQISKARGFVHAALVAAGAVEDRLPKKAFDSICDTLVKVPLQAEGFMLHAEPVTPARVSAMYRWFATNARNAGLDSVIAVTLPQFLEANLRRATESLEMRSCTWAKDYFTATLYTARFCEESISAASASTFIDACFRTSNTHAHEEDADHFGENLKIALHIIECIGQEPLKQKYMGPLRKAWQAAALTACGQGRRSLAVLGLGKAFSLASTPQDEVDAQAVRRVVDDCVQQASAMFRQDRTSDAAENKKEFARRPPRARRRQIAVGQS